MCLQSGKLFISVMALETNIKTKIIFPIYVITMKTSDLKQNEIFLQTRTGRMHVTVLAAPRRGKQRKPVFKELILIKSCAR